MLMVADDDALISARDRVHVHPAADRNWEQFTRLPHLALKLACNADADPT